MRKLLQISVLGIALSTVTMSALAAATPSSHQKAGKVTNSGNNPIQLDMSNSQLPSSSIFPSNVSQKASQTFGAFTVYASAGGYWAIYRLNSTVKKDCRFNFTTDGTVTTVTSTLVGGTAGDKCSATNQGGITILDVNLTLPGPA